MKNLLYYILFTLSLISCSSPTKKLTIATSANMLFPSEKLVASFEKATSIQCNIISSSSGKISSQIREKAPFNVFLSADIYYPEQLYKEGYTLEKPKTYAFGKLVLWLNDDIDSLSSSKINHIAIANPEVAPYGKTSIAYLKSLPLFSEIEVKLVYGESIAQVNQFITTQAVEAAITSYSTTIIPNLNGRFIDISKELYPPIEQGVVIINQDSKMNKQAKLFYDFLFSKEAKTILKECGYLVSEK